LGDSYLEHEYDSFKTQASNIESHEDLKEASALLEKNPSEKGFLQHLFDQVSAIFGIASDESARNESVAVYQSFISETIYDHMAMLARSPQTMSGGTFSIRQELTEGIAEEIGVGLYLTPEINEELHNRSETVLLELARDYQNWLLDDERQGIFETTWGYICTSNREVPNEVRNSHPLILNPDVDVARPSAASVVW
jgi:hypothetical protein